MNGGINYIRWILRIVTGVLDSKLNELKGTED